MLAVDQVIWNTKKKRTARHETIIARYRSVFGRQSLPSQQQMYSMCGQCARLVGSKVTQIENCEPDQLIKSGLIQPNQYNGIEISPEIHALNVQGWANLSWHNGDFEQVMSAIACKGEFVPGIINADLIQTPETGAALVAKIMLLVSEVARKEEVLLIANFILRVQHYTTKSGDYAIQKLKKLPTFRHAVTNANWQLLDKYCQYTGSDPGNRTRMGSLILALNAPLLKTN